MRRSDRRLLDEQLKPRREQLAGLCAFQVSVMQLREERDAPRD